MQNQLLKQFVRAIGMALFVVVTGLLIYDGPPDDWGTALWQPTLQGILAFLGAYGINMATRTPR